MSLDGCLIELNGYRFLFFLYYLGKEIERRDQWIIFFVIQPTTDCNIEINWQKKLPRGRTRKHGVSLWPEFSERSGNVAPRFLVRDAWHKTRSRRSRVSALGVNPARRRLRRASRVRAVRFCRLVYSEMLEAHSRRERARSSHVPRNAATLLDACARKHCWPCCAKVGSNGGGRWRAPRAQVVFRLARIRWVVPGLRCVFTYFPRESPLSYRRPDLISNGSEARLPVHSLSNSVHKSFSLHFSVSPPLPPTITLSFSLQRSHTRWPCGIASMQKQGAYAAPGPTVRDGT